jgi:hypothetical protein
MVLVRSKWSLRPTRWRRDRASGVVGGSDPTRRQPAQIGLPPTTPNTFPRTRRGRPVRGRAGRVGVLPA